MVSCVVCSTTLKEYEGRLTILQRAAKMAGLIQKTKTGEMKAVGGATGLVPILLEGMKMFPLDVSVLPVRG